MPKEVTYHRAYIDGPNLFLYWAEQDGRSWDMPGPPEDIDDPSCTNPKDKRNE